MDLFPKNKFKKYLQDTEIKVISVDVFDTLLFRNTAPEAQRFKQISKLQVDALNAEGSFKIAPIDFYLLRRECARTAYYTRTPSYGAREANWNEIMGLMFSWAGIPPEPHWFSLCAEVEMTFEVENLFLNKNLLKLLESASDQDKSTVCLSDMYLTSGQISQLIDRVAGRKLNLSVISSADHGYGKGCGELFQHLARQYQVPLSSIFHCGDNAFSDFEVPRSLGIKAHFTPRNLPWRAVRKTRSYLFNRSLPCL